MGLPNYFSLYSSRPNALPQRYSYHPLCIQCEIESEAMSKIDSPTQAPHATSKGTILRLSGVVARLGVARSTIYDWMNPESPRYDEHFPRPLRLSIHVGRGAIGFRETDICNWIDSRVTVSPHCAGGKHEL